MSQDQDVTPKIADAIPLRLPDISFDLGVWPNPHDKLGRGSEIQNLTPIILNAQSPLVFAIEAPWGAGKTTFIKLWEQYLQSQGCVSLTLNAWENDFCDDPLLPLLATFDDWLSKLKHDGTASQAWKKAKALTPGLLKASAIAAVKVGTLGALDLEKAVEGVIAGAAGEVAGDLVDSFKSKMGTLAKFKILLAEALDALPYGQANLVVFIDELDRCRPSYAVELLERIKHLFDIEKVVFVLSLNREQLAKSLGGMYGPNFDGEHYLKRFIDLDYKLEVSDLRQYIEAKMYQPDVKKRADSNRAIHDEMNWVKETFVWLCNRFNYQLRDVDQLITRFRLVLRSIPVNHHLKPQLLSVLLVLREQDQRLYEKLCKDPKLVNDALLFLLGRPFDDGIYAKAFPVVAGVMIGSLAEDDVRKELLNYWCEVRDKYESNDERFRTASRIVRIANDEDGWDGSRVLELVYRRIELVENFNIS